MRLTPRSRADRLRVAAPRPELPPFDTIAAKLRPPQLRPGTVSRTGLVNRLRAEQTLRLTTVLAPAGFGKTTLLAQWASRDERPFVWLTVDEHDRDPLVLLRHLAAGLDRVQPLDPLVTAGISAPGQSPWIAAAPRLVAAFASCPQPLVVVLDDVHVLPPGEAADVVLALAESVPKGSMLVLAGRREPSLPVARLRAAGRLLELGPDDLALTRREAQLLVRGTGADPEDSQVADALGRAEGWAAGLYLAASTLAEAARRGAPPDVHGDDRFLAAYFRAEVLGGVAPARLAFMRRTSVLERLSGSLCDAVLGGRRSGPELEAIARAGLLLVPFDRRGGWWRYHHLLRDELRRELQAAEPDLVPVLHRRAADWLEAHGDLERAREHALAAGDVDRAARLLVAVAEPAFHAGRLEAVERWLEDFAGHAPLGRFPALAALGAWVAALRGGREDSDRLAAAADRTLRARKSHASAPVRGSLLLLRTAVAPDGADGMRLDLAAAGPKVPADSRWFAHGLALDGVAAALRGDMATADAVLARAAATAEGSGADAARVLATAERSLLAAGAGDHPLAERLALEARAVLEDGGAEPCATGALAHAAAARAFLRHGRWDEARRELEAAERLSPYVTAAVPWLALQARLELGGVYVALRDADGARREIEAIDALLEPERWRSCFGERATELRRALEALSTTAGHSTRLTSAELRLVPLLATHLSFREIGERLFVSRNTIKTQAISVYRKLGVTSRSAAIERAVELGLVGDITSTTDAFTPTR